MGAPHPSGAERLAVVRLPEGEQAAGTARRFARTWAAQQQLTVTVVDNLELVVSELVGNAIRHGAPPYDVDLAQSEGAIHGVVDESLRLPEPSHTPDERGGFGLGIVAACTSRWGAEFTSTGKQGWFELRP
jgi:anti-sigma regulatory factor (Ser/Thr protein kinase)